MKKYTQTGLSLPVELYEKIESSRGDVSRSRFLLRILQKGLSEERKHREYKADNQQGLNPGIKGKKVDSVTSQNSTTVAAKGKEDGC
jgi:metal-responsive CopG/Arc/MetJ family transcriptional regulator